MRLSICALLLLEALAGNVGCRDHVETIVVDAAATDVRADASPGDADGPVGDGSAKPDSGGDAGGDAATDGAGDRASDSATAAPGDGGGS
ncbi:MAG: hypothetical protein ABUL67_03035 [Haliangium ochraceum]